VDFIAELLTRADTQRTPALLAWFRAYMPVASERIRFVKHLRAIAEIEARRPGHGTLRPRGPGRARALRALADAIQREG